jgi:hypothetical protein
MMDKSIKSEGEVQIAAAVREKLAQLTEIK